MCGIVGFTGPPDRQKLNRMLDLIEHRGPDGMGIHEDDLISFGHRRLSVIDEAGGAQPFLSSDGKHILNYNGELYNFRQLGDTLRSAGGKLRSKSDTEVLLYWLARSGHAGLADLNGMFAFAYWNDNQKTLLLARDRLGIKPLYYTKVDGRLIFASEIKALLVWRLDPRTNYRAVGEFLSFQNVLSEHTFFRDIYKLQPGRWLRWSPGDVRQGTFWDVKFGNAFNGNFADAVSQYRQVLDQAVTRHVIADVPVGAYLSSGIDSSSVTAIAATKLARPMRTFTGAFEDAPYYDERQGARLVSDALQAEQNDILIRPRDFVENFEKVVWHLDEPTLGTGALPQFMVSRTAARHVKVVLTGHGGDELFAGYQVFKAMMIRQAANNSLAQLARSILQVKKDELTRVLYYLLGPLVYPEVGHGLFVMNARNQRRKRFSADFLHTFDTFEPFALVREIIEAGKFGASEAILALYLKTYLPTLFTQEDKMGMAHSLEARMPLCDNALVDYAMALPVDLKLHAGNLKAIPKAAMKGTLPAALFNLPKRGFPTPFAKWFRVEPVRSFMEELLFSQRARERNIHNPQYVERLWRRNLTSRTDMLADYARANRLYSMALLEQWHRTFIDK
jgi:asparagine synthase (glutamine-hydrolysing)